MTRTTNRPQRGVLYLRISDDRDGKAAGVARQRKECTELFNARGIEIVHVYEDNDISATSGKRRPEYEQMRTDLANNAWGPLGYVGAWASDRLVRQPRELEDLIDTLNAKDLAVLTVVGGTTDLTTSDGRMVARMLGAHARADIERMQARIRSKHREIAEAGLPNGGRRVYGYEPDGMTVVESEAAIIREIAARILANESVRSITLDLANRNVPTARGGKWNNSQVKDTVTRPRNAGIREHNGKHYPAAWPPILDEPTWKRVCAILNDPTRLNMGKRGRPVKLLTGIAVCGLCGAPLKSQSRTGTKPGERHAGYSCRREGGQHGCGGVSIKAEHLEDVVIKATIAALDELQGQTVEPTDDDDAADLRELTRITNELDDLANRWAQGEISRKRYDRDANALERAEATINARMAARIREAQPVALIAGWNNERPWDDLSIDVQRALIQSVIESITVQKPVRSGRFGVDPERVKVTFRV